MDRVDPNHGRDTDSYYRYALDHTAIVAITDRAGNITFVNSKFCQLSGYTREELIGQNHRIVNSGVHPRSFFAEMFRVITRGETWRGDICNRAKDGSLYWVDTTIVPAPGPDGRVESFIAIRHDITERKNRESEARDAVDRMRADCEAKSEFLANMSHEIRTPMNAILGYAELLKEDSITPAQRTEHLDTIIRNGQHLLTIINDILDMSKIEAGKMLIEHIEVSPIEILLDSIELMRVRADGKALPLEIEFETPIPAAINTDPVRLRQILLNLIGNAIKFTEVGGIRVLVGIEDAMGDQPVLRIEVADTGIGMSREQIDSLFKPFQQADSSTTRRFGGTGLGLHISARLVEMLGGDIVVQSEVGRGSSFVVRIPTGLIDAGSLIEPSEAWQLLVRRREEDRAEKINEQTARPLEGVSVLLAEDGPDNQRLISHFIRKAGGAITLAANGREAVEHIEAGGAYDVILMDMQMPEMSGPEAIGEIRRLGCRAPIITLTAHATEREREQSLAAGSDDFVTKPVPRKTLIEVVASWAERGKRAAA